MKPNKKNDQFIQLIKDIKEVVETSRKRVNREVNNQLLLTYWQIGKMIIEKEESKTNTSRQLILELSKELTRELGRGFSRSNLFNMRQFYLNYPVIQMSRRCLDN